MKTCLRAVWGPEKKKAQSFGVTKRRGLKRKFFMTCGGREKEGPLSRVLRGKLKQKGPFIGGTISLCQLIPRGGGKKKTK